MYEKYLGTVAAVSDIDYAVVLLREYSDGFLTSAGFYKFDDVMLPEEPVHADDARDCLLYHAVACTELPVGFKDMWCILADEKEILIEADDVIEYVQLSGTDPSATGMFVHIDDVDAEAVLDYVNDERPVVSSPDEEHPAFIHSGVGHSWCLLCNVF